MKASTFIEASKNFIEIKNYQGNTVGKLIPVGEWVLDNMDIVRFICASRQKAMRMFLAQFESTYQRTFEYLKKYSIDKEDRILFLIYDSNDNLIGHIGMAGVNAQSGELDNLMRGAKGGNPQLIYFSELALLDWCFKNLGITQSDVRVLSYNWMTIDLHEEVGYKHLCAEPLRKYIEGESIFHEPVEERYSNVKYKILKMLLTKENFYKSANWLA